MDAPIYVVVCANDKPHPRWGADPEGAIVHETYVKHATLKKARERCAMLERHGACRIARLVFEDQPAELPREQQAKDHLFRAVVHALR